MKVKTRILLCCLLIVLVMSGCAKRKVAYVTEYADSEYDHSIKWNDTYAMDLCLVSDFNEKKEKVIDDQLKGYGAFSEKEYDILGLYNSDKKVYPASTTKVMTALLALESGKLDETVTVSKYAIESLEEGSSVCDLHVGDKLTLNDLLYGLLLESGNDAAVAIAEHLSGGSEVDFVTMMNERAGQLGATRTHFVNAHGLHDKDHYTTVYDLYLIFNEALKYDEFREVLETKEFNTAITTSDGNMRSVNWKPTNYYASGDAKEPKGTTILGGKTGTTDQAGSCLVLYSKSDSDEPFVTIVMGAVDKEVLYKDMNALLKRENRK